MPISGEAGNCSASGAEQDHSADVRQGEAEAREPTAPREEEGLSGSGGDDEGIVPLDLGAAVQATKRCDFANFSHYFFICVDQS